MVIYATLINDLEENVIYLLIKITPRVGNRKDEADRSQYLGQIK